MLDAEQELVRLGAKALPILAAFFAGDAQNQFGVPYRRLPLALDCALVACRLGPIAKPLEPYLREELCKGHHTAAMALRSLGSLDELSIKELAQALKSHEVDLSHEAAVALIRCEQGDRAYVPP